MQERKKKLAVEEAWKMQYNKEERKKRYRDQGKAEALAEKRQKRDWSKMQHHQLALVGSILHLYMLLGQPAFLLSFGFTSCQHCFVGVSTHNCWFEPKLTDWTNPDDVADGESYYENHIDCMKWILTRYVDELQWTPMEHVGISLCLPVM